MPANEPADFAVHRWPLRTMQPTVRKLFASPRFWRWLLAGYWLALLVGTHLPRTFPALPGERTDKLVHLAAYGVLAWLLATAWQMSSGWLTRRHLTAAWLLLVVVAAVDEATQPLVNRHASVGDWLADAAGAAIGLVAFAWWHRRREARQPPLER